MTLLLRWLFPTWLVPEVAELVVGRSVGLVRWWAFWKVNDFVVVVCVGSVGFSFPRRHSVGFGIS